MAGWAGHLRTQPIPLLAPHFQPHFGDVLCAVAIACLSSGNLRVLPRRIGPDQKADECKEHAAPYENAASRPDNDPSALVGCCKEATDYCNVAEKPEDSGV